MAQLLNSLKMNWVGLVVDTHTVDKEGAGNVRIDFMGNMYRYVLNSTGAPTAVGDTLFHGTGNTLGYLSEVFQEGQSGKGTLLSTMAGVCMSVIPTAGYGWIQISGYNAAITVDGTTDVVVGDALKGVTGHSYLVHDVAVGTAPTEHNTIIALAGFTTDTTQSAIAGWIHCV